ncbi:hypothetical protein AMTRI_Chr11g97040 [Amborella trichopoda]
MRSKQLRVPVLRTVAMLQEVAVLAMAQCIPGCIEFILNFLTCTGTLPTLDCCKAFRPVKAGCWAGFRVLNQVVIAELKCFCSNLANPSRRRHCA